jgi:hypothetical protein
VATALRTYLQRVEGSLEMEKTIEREKADMVMAILKTRLQIKAKEENKLKLSNAIWSIILVGFFKGSSNITEKEIRLYLLKQEKSEGRDRKQKTIDKNKGKREAVLELMIACYEDWKRTKEGRDLLAAYSSDNELAFSHSDVAAKHEALVDTIARTKNMTIGQRAALQAYDSKLMQKLGTLMYVLLRRSIILVCKALFAERQGLFLMKPMWPTTIYKQKQ